MTSAPPGQSRFLSRRGLVAAALLFGLVWLLPSLVPIPDSLGKKADAGIRFTDRNGQPLRDVPEEDERFYRPVSLEEISPHLVAATLSAEDKRFWLHAGWDPAAMTRAAYHAIRYGRFVSGASTITQQLIKVSHPRPRTFRVKLHEIFQAVHLERQWSKKRILEEYLNRVDYGNARVGCAAACHYYFGKPVADLSPAEAALLAGIPQAPTRLNPYNSFDKAKRRQVWILKRMTENGYLTPSETDRAMQERLRLRPARATFEAPHFIDQVMRSKPQRLPGTQVIRTTLDLNLNREVTRLARLQLTRLKDRHVTNAAAVVIDNRSGDVLALVGSENYFSPGAGQVNGAWAPRSAGSTFKPFTYLLALQQGGTPATVVADVPVEFVTSTGLFQPVNYNRRCYGPMRYRSALANSLNISAVKVLEKSGGAPALQDLLQRCGLTTLERPAEFYGLGLTIGNAEARLIELANAYAALARLGEYRPYHLTIGSGKTTTAPSRVADSATAWLLADILSDGPARALAFGLESPLRWDFPVAAKTGTSSDFRDNWAFGFTPEFTVGVWTGNFDGSPMREVSGVTGAAPILHGVFVYLQKHHGTSWYEKPASIVTASIDPITGHQLPGSRAGAITEYFLKGHLPPVATASDYNSSGLPVLSAGYAAWFASGDNALVGRAVCPSGAVASRYPTPLPGTIYYLDPDLPASTRKISLSMPGFHEPLWTCATLTLHKVKGTTIAALKEGKHELTVTDRATGESRRTWVEVRAL